MRLIAFAIPYVAGVIVTNSEPSALVTILSGFFGYLAFTTVLDHES